MSLHGPLQACHLLCVVAARPNYMKMAPILAALARLRPAPRLTLVHTGQHYDQDMNSAFFQALAMPAPDYNLAVGSGSHAQQTAEVMRRFEPVLEHLAPSAVLLVGDVNSTLACALVAAKMRIAVLHVEAGLRSFDRAMPEEVNRVLTDQISTLLFTSEQAGNSNLLREGIAPERIHFVGNVMIDSLLQCLPSALPVQQTLAAAGFDPALIAPRGYALLTLHRPANVDQPQRLHALVAAMVELAKRLPLLFPVHPRTRAMLERAGLLSKLELPGLLCLPPLGYLEMLGVLKDARLVLTDSGGVQEESTALGLPCLTLRENTERPVTVSEGSNALAGRDPATILALSDDILLHGGKRGRVPQYWDGHAAGRIAEAIAIWHAGRQALQP